MAWVSFMFAHKLENLIFFLINSSVSFQNSKKINKFQVESKESRSCLRQTKKASQLIPEARRVEFLEKYMPEKTKKNTLRMLVWLEDTKSTPNLDSRATKNKSLIKLERSTCFLFRSCYVMAEQSDLT